MIKSNSAQITTDSGPQIQNTAIEDTEEEVGGILREKNATLKAIQATQQLVNENDQMLKKAALNQEIIELSEIQNDNEKLENKIFLLNEKKKILDKNKDFLNKNSKWLNAVAGNMGLDDSKELITENENGFYEISLRTQAALSAAEDVVKRKLPDLRNLIDNYYFLKLIALYYLKNDLLKKSNVSRFDTVKSSYVQHDIEKTLYKIITQNTEKYNIQRVLLGNLADCDEIN
jgi:hypothetical protein